MSILLNAIDISKSYSHKVLLKNIKLAINKNDCIAIGGDSASGKSTLLKIIAGKIKPDYGCIRAYCDLNVVYCSPMKFESSKTVSNFLNNNLKNYSSNSFKNKAENLLDDFDLIDYLNVQLKFLSHSISQRVNLVHSLLSMVDILILDDPTTYLDKYYVDILINNLKNYLRSGGSIIFSDNNKEFIDNLSKIYYEIESCHLKQVRDFNCKYEIFSKKMVFVSSMHSLAISPNILERINDIKRDMNKITLYVPISECDYVLKSMIDAGYFLCSLVDQLNKN